MSDAQQGKVRGQWKHSPTYSSHSRLLRVKNWEYFSFLTFRDFQNSIALTGRTQGFACWQALLLARAVVKMKINVGHWWNDTDKGKPKYSERNLSQRHLVHHKSHTDFRVNINLRYT